LYVVAECKQPCLYLIIDSVCMWLKLDMFDIHTHTNTHTHCKGPLRCLYLDVNIYVANMYVKAECM
jgi:hypothetical protein